ncbi:MAG: N-formylglutamate amidohydrolase [Aestuariivita sp.]|nr:N-formylglutamate amidohydrolase [Aestuariivita sp.]
MTYSPYFVHGQHRSSRWLITCDHATNTIPSDIGSGTLGLCKGDLKRHISYDIGAFGVALKLGKELKAPVLSTNFSRLIIDPNRGPQDPTLVMKLSDGTIIPSNKTVSKLEIENRKTRFYWPYDQQLAQLCTRQNIVIISVHSFTRQLRGQKPRPWDIGILHTSDERIARPLIKLLSDSTKFRIGDNEPYSGHLPGDAIDRHATRLGRPNALLEIRNDLIETQKCQREMATILAPFFEEALRASKI